jgi:hypothetical protein
VRSAKNRAGAAAPNEARKTERCEKQRFGTMRAGFGMRPHPRAELFPHHPFEARRLLDSVKQRALVLIATATVGDNTVLVILRIVPVAFLEFLLQHGKPHRQMIHGFSSRALGSVLPSAYVAEPCRRWLLRLLLFCVCSLCSLWFCSACYSCVQLRVAQQQAAVALRQQPRTGRMLIHTVPPREVGGDWNEGN